MNKLIVICGPTSTGKTELGVRIAKELDAELVSADSRQIYKGMDIGTGKDLPSKEKIDKLLLKASFKEKKYSLVPYRFHGVPLWMVDVVNPDEDFSVSHYHSLATQVIADMTRSSKLAIVVGGTGLYIRSLIRPPETLGIPPNSDLRRYLETLSVNELQVRLKEQFPNLWKSLNSSDRANPRRLIRKIEIGQAGDFPLKSQHPLQDVFIIGLYSTNEELQKKIDARVNKRLQQGIISEIDLLLKQGYGWNLHSMSSLGYKEWQVYFDALENKKTSNLDREKLKEKVIAKWVNDEHDYAKRQMAWFKKEPNIQWHNIASAYYQDVVIRKVIKWHSGS